MKAVNYFVSWLINSFFAWYPATFLPYTGTILEDGAIEFIKAYDGHFYIQAQIGDNGHYVLFIVDTGASHVILMKKDALDAGINLDCISTFGIYATPLKSEKARILKIPITVGHYTITDVHACVRNYSLPYSFLGMNLLNNFHITVTDNKLILRRY